MVAMAQRPSSRTFVAVAMLGGLVLSGCGGSDGSDSSDGTADSPATTPVPVEIDESLPLADRAESIPGITVAAVDVTGDELDVTMPPDATVEDAALDCLAVGLVLTDDESAHLHYPDGDQDCDR
jgi:hypothetical protein